MGNPPLQTTLGRRRRRVPPRAVDRGGVARGGPGPTRGHVVVPGGAVWVRPVPVHGEERGVYADEQGAARGEFLVRELVEYRVTSGDILTTLM